MTDHTQGPALAPCPFCGSTSLHIETNSVQPDDFHDAWVHCDECDAEGRHAMTLDGWLPSKAEAKAEAVVAWNRRSIPQGDEPAKDAAQSDDPIGDLQAEARQAKLEEAVRGWSKGAAQGDELPPLPTFMRAHIERAIKEAEHPKGMSLHDGMARVNAEYLRRLMVLAEAADQMREYGAACRAGAKADARDAALEEAVRKLVKAKGRFHTEQNYKALVAALDKFDAARSAHPGGAEEGGR